MHLTVYVFGPNSRRLHLTFYVFGPNSRRLHRQLHEGRIPGHNARIQRAMGSRGLRAGEGGQVDPGQRTQIP